MFPRSIRYLLAVAEHHSFTRAADALYVSQPTLSQQIKQLEEQLDVQLLDRSGRSVRLTDAGEVYLHHARRALGELDAGQRAIHELQDLSRGALRIGMTPITEYLATPVLDRFNAFHPGIRLSTLEMPQDEIETAVIEDRIDIGITFTNRMASESRSNEIDTQILFVETLNLAVGRSHRLAGQRSAVDAHAIEQLPLVLLNSGFALRRHVDLYCLEHGIEPNIMMETNSLSVIIELVRRGRFTTILPETIACSQRGLCPVLMLPQLPHHTITMICRKSAYKSPACHAFGTLAGDWSTSRCTKKDGQRMRPCPMSDVCSPEQCQSDADDEALDEAVSADDQAQA